MKKIYIILMHTYTIPSKLIKFFTRYEYTHVCLSLQKECNEIYSFGRKELHSFWNSGMVIEKKTGSFFKKFNKTKCQIYELAVKENSYQKLENILKQMKEKIEDYKYDFVGLIPRYFGIPLVIKNRYVCSFFVAEVLEKAQIIHFKKTPCLIQPQDFSALKELKKIYEGKYLMYKNEA